MDVQPLSAQQIRQLVRKHARLLAFFLDMQPCGYDLDFDTTVAVASRLIVEDGPLFCEMACAGTGASNADVQAMPWASVVKVGCEVIEATREAWRPAWESGFLQKLVCQELRPFSAVARQAAR